MTDTSKPSAADIRRATVLALHHRRGDLEGCAAIAEESNAADRAPQLLLAVLAVHQLLIGLLRPPNAIPLIADYVHGLAGLPPEDRVDTVRAAGILDGHGRGDPAAIKAIMAAAVADGRPTQTVVALLELYETVLPELSSRAGVEWLASQIPALAAAEYGEQP